MWNFASSYQLLYYFYFYHFLPPSVTFYYLPPTFTIFLHYLLLFPPTVTSFLNLYHSPLIKNVSISFFFLFLTYTNPNILFDAMIHAIILCLYICYMPCIVSIYYTKSNMNKSLRIIFIKIIIININIINIGLSL